MKYAVSFVVLTAVLLSSCRHDLGPGPIHLHQVWSMTSEDSKAYDRSCTLALNHPKFVTLQELLTNPAKYDRSPVTVTGKYVVTERISELRLASKRGVWVVMPTLRADLNSKNISITGTFTTIATSPERPAATIC